MKVASPITLEIIAKLEARGVTVTEIPCEAKEIHYTVISSAEKQEMTEAWLIHEYKNGCL